MSGGARPSTGSGRAVAGLPLVRLQSFIDEEELCEQGAQVNRRVEVVDELRSDRRLREHDLNRGARVARIAVDHVEKRAIGRGVEAELLDERRRGAAERLQRIVTLRQ